MLNEKKHVDYKEPKYLQLCLCDTVQKHPAYFGYHNNQFDTS